VRALVLVLAGIVAQAQAQGGRMGIPDVGLTLPDTPSATAVRREPPWSWGDVLLAGGFLALTGIDAAATQAGFAGSTAGRPWHEQNPLVPRSSTGRAAYFTAGAAGTIGLAWWLHRWGHGRLARGVLAAGIVMEGYAAGHSLWGLRQ